MWRHIFPRRRDRRTSRVQRSLEDALFQLLIALANLFLLVGEQLLEILGVLLNGVGEVDEIERQDLRVGQTHHRRAYSLRQGSAVDEIEVGKMRVPVKIVVNGMVNSLLVLASIAQAQRGNRQVVDK